MENTIPSQGIRLFQEMTKILFFSIKTLFVICSTWLVAPLAEMSDQIDASTPPVFMFYFFNFLLFSHEVVIAASKSFRRWIFSAYEHDGKLDYKQLLASGLSLWCIRLFVYGKLLEVHFGSGFDDKTYYYLIVIILILVGGVVLEKSLATVLKRLLGQK